MSATYIYPTLITTPSILATHGITKGTSYIFYSGSGYFWGENGANGSIDFGGSGNSGSINGSNACAVLNAVANAVVTSGAGKVIIRNGVYPITQLFSTTASTTASLHFEGESRDSVIFDLTNCPVPSQVPVTSPYADFSFNIPTLIMRNITFRNAVTPNMFVVGVGEGAPSNTPSHDCLVEDIIFTRSCAYGFAFYDGSGTIVQRVKGDNPAEIVTFWGGTESNITCRDIFMQPTLSSYPTPQGLDDTISFNVVENGASTNITCENIVGDYSIAFGKNGSQLALIGGVIDFAGFANQTWNKIHCKHIVGLYASALYMAYAYAAISNSVFEDIHSSYGGKGTGINQNGINMALIVGGTQVTGSFKNVTFKDIYIDHAKASGINLWEIGVESAYPGGTNFMQNVTLENLYLWDNNQNQNTYDYQGTSGLDIGGFSTGSRNLINGITVSNIYAWDDQDVPTQAYPMSFIAYGYPATSQATNVTVSKGVFSNNIHNTIGFDGNFNFSNFIAKDIHGYVTQNFGYSTGTGAQQTIEHGLYQTPTSVNITPTVSDSTVSGIYCDSTYIYCTVTNEKTFYWRADTDFTKQT